MAPNSFGVCSICHDKATGNHYGTESCDGCKGFFRRTVRKQRRYECRFDSSCEISRDRRNSCRCCRYVKCLEKGMRISAVQHERDRIGALTRRNAHCEQLQKTDIKSCCDTKTIQDDASLMPADARLKSQDEQIACLLEAEECYAQLRQSVISQAGTSSGQAVDASCFKVANLGELQELIKQQLLLLVTWLKQIPVFAALPIPDQVPLLRGFAAEYLLLSLAKRSLPYTDFLLLFNEALILQRNGPELIMDMNCITERVLDELVQPMRELCLDEIEYMCLKAVAFFNPNCCSRKSVGFQTIQKKRQLILCSFEAHVLQKPGNESGRLGSLFLLLPTLQSIGVQLRESVQLAELFGIAKGDALLLELLGTSRTTGAAHL